MAMLICKIHGWVGAEDLTPLAATAFDTQNILPDTILVELIFHEAPFFVVAQKSEFPFPNTVFAGAAYNVANEGVLNEILGHLSPRCARCLSEKMS